MKELSEYRVNLMEKLRATAEAFRDQCLAVKDPYAPLTNNGWSVHQIAAHTRDVAKLVYGLRARRTATEDNPKFQNFDGEAYMAEHYDASEPMPALLNDFVGSIEALIVWLHTLPVETWSRVS